MAPAAVSIYTLVHNSKPFLPQCIDSVLNQTYRDFEYIVVDNGSTDGSRELLEEYAARDSRIRLVLFEENLGVVIWLKVAQETARGKYIANLDSDDWWEPDYLESLIGFLEKHNLDLAVTGTVNYYETTGDSLVLRQLNTPAILTVEQFAQAYPQLWVFPSTNWANIMRTELFQRARPEEVIAANLSNSGDTVSMLRYMAQCSRIGIDSTALHHYRIRPKQVSQRYHPRRFDSNVYCNEEIQRFLELHHTFDPPKREWLKWVYINATGLTLNLLKESELSADEKIAECARIASHPRTVDALNYLCPERDEWFRTAWEITLKAAADPALSDAGALTATLAALAPKCGPAVTKDTAPLFAREPELLSALYRDDRDRLAEALLDLIAVKRYVKRYDLAGMLRSLAADKPLLRGVEDTRFLRGYRDIYRLVWEGKHLQALEDMTGLLLEKELQGGEETFFQLYLSLAALLEQVPAFLFGKIRLARFYLSRRRAEECRAILAELEDMGAEEHEDLIDIRQRLAALEEGR